jgi:hypothetical protein
MVEKIELLPETPLPGGDDVPAPPVPPAPTVIGYAVTDTGIPAQLDG